MTADDELSPREAARIRARERKARPPKMVIDNAGVGLVVCFHGNCNSVCTPKHIAG